MHRHSCTDADKVSDTDNDTQTKTNAYQENCKHDVDKNPRHKENEAGESAW